MRTCEKCGSEVLIDGKAPQKAIPSDEYNYYRRVQMAEGQLEELKVEAAKLRGALTAVLPRIGMPIDHDTRALWREEVCAVLAQQRGGP